MQRLKALKSFSFPFPFLFSLFSGETGLFTRGLPGCPCPLRAALRRRRCRPGRTGSSAGLSAAPGAPASPGSSPVGPWPCPAEPSGPSAGTAPAPAPVLCSCLQIYSLCFSRFYPEIAVIFLVLRQREDRRRWKERVKGDRRRISEDLLVLLFTLILVSVFPDG